uniref:Conotoxin Cal6.31 n=1 Tax=Californiconus californicus TaxID=1736779 RepID=O1631_CONCL|nr:RecName: Full=Conotoxin Cal6.31; AltName: Full=O1_cal6.31; Flags: Precursor [Californiconus californicus]
MKLTCVLIAAVLLLAVCQLDSADAITRDCKTKGYACFASTECCVQDCWLVCLY